MLYSYSDTSSGLPHSETKEPWPENYSQYLSELPHELSWFFFSDNLF